VTVFLALSPIAAVWLAPCSSQKRSPPPPRFVSPSSPSVSGSRTGTRAN